MISAHQRDTCLLMFIATLFTMSEIQDPIGGWRDKERMVYIHNGIYSAIRRMNASNLQQNG
jgi:hypothetical protein